jgi:quercetin dioxygenase-like cupin family protein
MRKKIDCHTETIESVELIRSSTSWNGTSLPDYPLGKPELVAVKYIIPPGQKLGWHHHIAMNHGVLIQGELTVVGLDGQTKVFREGDVIVEMVEDIHHGENQGATTVILYMFYLAQENVPLSVQHPEIPIK